MAGIINFVETPTEVGVDKSSKKFKFSSRSFALVKKATLKIKESLAKKMEAQKVELAKQYQEAHEIVKKAAQEESHKNKKEYDQIKLQVLTDELKSIGVKLILTDYVTTRLSVQGQSRAIKMPNFWQNIKRILSTVNMVNREFKDIGRSYGYGGIDRGNEGLDNMHKMIFGEKEPAKELAKEKVVQAPVQPKAPEPPKTKINSDYDRRFVPNDTQSLNSFEEDLNKQLAEASKTIDEQYKAAMAKLSGNNPVTQSEVPISNSTNTAFTPSESISYEEPKRAELNAKVANVFESLLEKRAKEAKTASSEPVVPSTTAPVNKSEENLDREALMQGLINRYGNDKNQSTVTTPPVVPTQEADTKGSTQPPIHYLNSTIGDVYPTGPKKEDSEKIPYNVSPEEYYKLLSEKSREQTIKEVDKRIAVEKEAESLRKQLEEAREELERLRGLSQPNPNFGGVVSPPKR